jgi:uncharacterized protein CbrC (UPF0167 family)
VVWEGRSREAPPYPDCPIGNQHEFACVQYHPDPIATGCIIESDTECCCCKKLVDLFIAHVYAKWDYNDCICPWCISDGTAYKNLGASFTDGDGIGGYGDWDDVPKSVIEEIAYYTPGFSGRQQEQWWTHCGDAGQFLGRAGRKELINFGEDAIASIKESFRLNEGQME